MDINCNPFSILDDKGKGHIGTHKTLMGQVIHDNDGETLRTAMATFCHQIIQCDNSFLAVSYTHLTLPTSDLV